VKRTTGGRDGALRLTDCWSLPTTAARAKRRAGAAAGGSSTRLGKGELGGLVLAYLRDHPGEHSPTALAKALDGRSSGAVANALVRRRPNQPSAPPLPGSDPDRDPSARCRDKVIAEDARAGAPSGTPSWASVAGPSGFHHP